MSDDNDGTNILRFPPAVGRDLPAGGDVSDVHEEEKPIIGRRELRELVINVARLLDAFDLYISQVRTLAHVARDRPGVSGEDIDRIIENAQTDGKRLGEIRAAYKALADTLDQPGDDSGAP